MHRACAYKGSKLGPEKQACQNPKVGSRTVCQKNTQTTQLLRVVT